MEDQGKVAKHAADIALAKGLVDQLTQPVTQAALAETVREAQRLLGKHGRSVVEKRP